MDVKKLNSLVQNVFTNQNLSPEEKIIKLTLEYKANDEVISKDIISHLFILGNDMDVIINNVYSDEYGNLFVDFIKEYAKDNFIAIKELLPLCDENYFGKERLDDIKFSILMYDNLVHIFKMMDDFNSIDFSLKEILKEKVEKGGILKFLNKRNQEKLDEFNKEIELKKASLKQEIESYMEMVNKYKKERGMRILNAYMERNINNEEI